MNVLVDTPVWSLALRRNSEQLNQREIRVTQQLAELIRDGRAQVIGVVRQELLSGIRESERFERLREYLRAFPEPTLEIRDFEEAAKIHNTCRTRGIAGSTIDFLICAAARRRNWQIFTTDHDFRRYASALPLRLYSVS